MADAEDISNYRLSIPETQIFIDLYRGHEALWNYSHKFYKNRSAKLAAYKSMQLAFQAATGTFLPISILKTKLSSFRTVYKREHALVLKSIQAGRKVYKPKYEHYERLSFLKTVIKAKEDGLNTAINREDTDGAPSLQDLEQLQDFQVYNSPPDQDNDDDHDIDDSLSCDLSCDSIPDDKTVLRGLLEQNGALTPGPVKPSTDTVEQNHDEVARGDGSSSSFHGLNRNMQPSTECRPQGADQEVFSPLFRAQSMNKNGRRQQRHATRQHSNQRGTKRRHDADEDADSEDMDVTFSKTHRQEEEEEGIQSHGHVIHKLMGYLVEHMQRQEKRRSEKQVRKQTCAGMENGRSGDKLWARYLVHQISEIPSKKKRQLLKLKISQMVLECCMEELNKE